MKVELKEESYHTEELSLYWYYQLGIPQESDWLIGHQTQKRMERFANDYFPDNLETWYSRTDQRFMVQYMISE